MTGCFIIKLSQLPNILKTNGDQKDEKLEAIHNILGLVVKALDSQSRGLKFKATWWLEGRLSLSSFCGQEFLGT